MINVKKGDLVIGIGFPRYANKTINALDFAKSRGADVVAITDSKRSPLASKADYTLIAESNMASFVDSLVAPLSVINALIIAVGMKEKEYISEEKILIYKLESNVLKMRIHYTYIENIAELLKE